MDKMNNELSATYITLGGHVHLQKYRFLYFVIMFTAFVLIICSNSTILCLIWIQKSLHEPMYIFIAALLCNSLLFSTNVYPKLLIDFLSDMQITTYLSCRMQGLMYYSLSGSEFLLLAAMAYDRHVSICNPLQYQTVMSKTTVTTLLVLAWLLPPCQLVPALILGNSSKLCNYTLNGLFCNNAVTKLYCLGQSGPYILYGVTILMTTVFIPLMFILFTYSKILIISYRRGSHVRKKALQTCAPHLLVLLSFSCLCSYDVIIARLEIDLPITAYSIMTLQVVLYHPLLNPIIYGLKMAEIHKHLKRLFSRGRFCVCILLR
ncbi:olfactory receptor 6N2-like [Girardinichthys multiradiatus]|uniref:olfactory receptor 6N2-like n=1 Tax=Girardinichthys multiradiatus TaxID=208333 RepID=UPI001FAE74B5|nr:olfactory receptor 6N2-like [Girardinichthys multiradiatus]